jgi:hypothetical protein
MSTPTVQRRRPRFRFRLWTLLELTAAVALGLYVWPSMVDSVLFTGEMPVDLEFVVVDAADGRPIEGALIRVVDPMHEDQATVSPSRTDGRVRMTYHFPMKGHHRAYQTTGTVSFEDCWLEASAAGHRSSNRVLADLTGNSRDIDSPHPPAMTLALEAGNDPTAPLGGIPGIYWRDGPSSDDCITILPDGRVVFRWMYSRGCSATQMTNLGYARLRGGLLVLSLVKRDRQYEIDAPTEFVPVSWGDRRYLLTMRSIVDFCNQVNQGIEPRPQLQGVAYLRAADWQKSTRGLPELPPEWTPYLLEEPVWGTIVEVMDENRARINRGLKDGLRPGMELLVQQPQICRLAVINVQPDSCIVTGVPGFCTRDDLKPGRKVGSRLSEQSVPGWAVGLEEVGRNNLVK